MKNATILLAIAITILNATPRARARVIHVPGECPTIAAGIFQAVAGDTVVVACGGYLEYGLVMKSGVLLTSESGSWDCVTIDAQGLGSHLHCTDLDENTCVQGFTFTGFQGEDEHLGAIECRDCYLTFFRCAILDNYNLNRTSGFYIYGGEPSLDECFFRGNVSYYGAGLLINNGTVRISNCTFVQNHGHNGYVAEGRHNAVLTLENSLLAYNTGGVPVNCTTGASVYLSCCNIYRNDGADWMGCVADQFNINGNIRVDPLFCDLEQGDFSLCADSPCLPENNDCGLLIGVFGKGCATCGVAFQEVTLGPLGDEGVGMGVALVDFDADDDLDIYVVNTDQANLLLRNDGGDVFVDVASGPLADAGAGRAAVWADYDNDGDLDLYHSRFDQANLLVRNEGDGSFTEVTAFDLGDEGPGSGVAWADFDCDGLVDLYLVNRGAENVLFRNCGDVGGGLWFFMPTGGVVHDQGNGFSCGWCDY